MLALTSRLRITSLVFETLLFVLSIHKFVGAVRQGWGRRPVMREFITDGTWAYTLIFSKVAFFHSQLLPSDSTAVTMFVNSMLYKLVKGSPLAGVCFTYVEPFRVLNDVDSRHLQMADVCSLVRGTRFPYTQHELL